jgi:GH24 family phage-related lysozyme (muramidase)
MLKWNTITNSSTYETRVFDLLVLLEGKTNAPYVDAVGVPTIGIGYNLRFNLDPVLRAIVGPGHWSATLYDRIKTQIDKSYASGDNALLRANLDQVMANWHDKRDADVPSTFRFATDGEISEVLQAIAPNYDSIIDDWLSGIPESQERAALFSLTWNAPSLLGPKLKTAIETGNRAEAWYEIRYNSNGIALSGIANRRYVEAEEFGLYDDPASVSHAEAVKIGRMLASHHEKILAYEDLYDPDAAGQIKGIAAIDRIDVEARAAIDVLRTRYGLDPALPIEELLAASGALPDVAGDGTTQDAAANDADLLLGTGQSNRLSGGTGQDVLIGLGGADILLGGKGADLFVFAKAADSCPGPAARDMIEDFQPGLDRIDLARIDANGPAAGHAFDFLTTEGEKFDGIAGQLRFRFADGNTFVEGDVDGNGRADVRIVLSGLKALTETDFLL